MSLTTDTLTRTVAVQSVTLEGCRVHDGSAFPLVLQLQEEASLADVVRWLEENRRELLDLASTHRTILFRSFPCRTAEDFDACVAAFELANFPYRKSLSNAVRVNKTERVFSANEAPPSVKIFLHHEMAQTPIFPTYLFFFCEKAADEGGATPLCPSDELVRRLETECPQFLRDCAAKGLQYTNVMPSADDPESGMGRSWQSTLGVQTREEAEQRLADLGYDGRWLEDGSLRATTPPLPAIRELKDGRRSFFNQLIAAYCGWSDRRNDPSAAIRHGDGSPLDRDAVMRAVEIAEELCFDVPWQAGDFTLLDNTVVMHGRRTFGGTRKVLASLAEPQQQSFHPA